MANLPVFIRDTREHEGHGFTWRKSTQCNGTVEKKLDTGDYSIEGFEDKFVIERKESPNEMIGNIFSDDKKRFYAELERLKAFKRCAIVCEFTLEDVAAHIKKVQKFSKAARFNYSMDKFLGSIASITAQYNVPFYFCGEAKSTFNPFKGTRTNTNHARDLSGKLLLKWVKYCGE